MSSTQPPSRVPPKGPSNDATTAQDKADARKVEKVREVDEIDADERTRKKFRAMMGDVAEDDKSTRVPSPFDSVFKEQKKEQPQVNSANTTNTPPARPQLGGEEDGATSSSDYASAPDIADAQAQQPEADWGDDSQNSLPRSNQFWKDVDSPETEAQRPYLQENPPRKKIFDDELPLPSDKSQKGEEKKGKEVHIAVPAEKLEGKDVYKEKEKSAHVAAPEKKAEKGKLPSPLDIAATKPEQKKTHKKDEPTTPQSIAQPFPTGIAKEFPTTKSTPQTDKKHNVDASLSAKDPDLAPMRPDGKSSDDSFHKDHKQQVDIISPSLPVLPSNVQPLAQAATTIATPYLHPSTVPLFFQMVGTMYVMAAPPGISRTEIVLNNPAFSNSKFFGATITIERFSTAPDSFNIRLTGSDSAVLAFKENVPSLMASFQNNNLPFRVHRLDVEYSAERPVFRRKDEGSGGKGGSGGGDLGERRNK